MGADKTIFEKGLIATSHAIDRAQTVHKEVVEKAKDIQSTEAKDTFESLVAEAEVAIQNAQSLYEKMQIREEDTGNLELKNQITELELELKTKIENLSNFLEAFLLSKEELSDETKREIQDLRDNGKNEKHLRTEYLEVPKEYVERYQKILSADNKSIQRTLFVALSALKDCKFPIIGMGSLPYSVLVENNIKPNDKDKAGSILDFQTAYAGFKAQEKAGKITNLKIIKITGLDGQPNGCFEINCKVVDGIEFSLFLSETNIKKPDNGLISAGRKQNQVYEFEVDNPDNPGEKVKDIEGAQGTQETLYAHNTLLEMSTFAFEDYKNGKDLYAWVTPKALQRIHKLLKMNGGDLNKVLEILQKTIAMQEDENTKKFFIKSYKLLERMISQMWQQDRFYKDGEPGLASKICAENKYPTETCGELSVNYVTNEIIKKEMQEVYNLWHKAEVTKTKEEEEPLNKLLIIQRIQKELEQRYIKYTEFTARLNNQDSNDHVIGLGFIALENEFLLPAAIQVSDMIHELRLKEAINN